MICPHYQLQIFHWLVLSLRAVLVGSKQLLDFSKMDVDKDLTSCTSPEFREFGDQQPTNCNIVSWNTQVCVIMHNNITSGFLEMLRLLLSFQLFVGTLVLINLIMDNNNGLIILHQKKTKILHWYSYGNLDINLQNLLLFGTPYFFFSIFIICLWI